MKMYPTKVSRLFPLSDVYNILLRARGELPVLRVGRSDRPVGYTLTSW